MNNYRTIDGISCDAPSPPDGIIANLADRSESVSSIADELRARVGILADRILGPEPAVNEVWDRADKVCKPTNSLDVITHALAMAEEALHRASAQLDRLYRL